ncbi:MAG TPA: clostripain-related cysteine peptidase [Lachnospiraceae bacterium]|nr:clostripain-related cysteine peptidase [Lachnospiraceae bacterium]
MKKKFLLITAIVTMLLLAACSKEDKTDKETLQEVSEESTEDTEEVESAKSYSPDDTWVIYWYLCGSDLESGGGAATSDLEEMLSVALPENVSVVIETGGSSTWQNDMVDPTKLQRYLYSGEEMQLVDEQELGNMGEASTLADFLSFCEENYPADHKMVLFWNHGGGSVGGAAYDENYEYDSLSLTEMQEAFSAVYGGQEKPLELIGFDTCLMSTLDTANVFKEYANYLVASEELEPGNGWYYSGWLGALASNPGMNGAELGTVICDTFVEGCEEAGTQDEITLAVTDLSKLDPLLEAFNGMGKELLSSAVATPSVCGEFARSASKAENYGGNNEEEGYTNMVDLGDLVSNSTNLIPETADQVMAALDEAIVYRVNGAYRQNATGLSVFYSYNGDSQNLTQYDEVAADDVYPYFVHYSIGEEIPEEAFTELDGVDYQDATVLEGFKEDMPVEITEDNYARLTLDPSSLDFVKSVYFNLAYYSEEDDIIVFLGKDNDLTADWDNGVFEDNFRGVWGALDESFCYMEITYEGDEYNLYSIPIYLNGKECVLRVAYDFKTESFNILGTREAVEEETSMADKNMVQLKPGDQVTPILYAMSLSGDGEDVTEFEGDTVTVTDSTEFTEMDLGDGTLAYMFEVVDTANKTYDSEIALFEYKNGEVSYLTE